MKGDTARDLLRQGLNDLGIETAPEQIGSFLKYLDELKKWNRAHNLTGLKTDREIIIKHFLDSVLFLKVLPGEVRTVADVGSGAGFPGIPMKIVRPDLQMYLIEASAKKAVFLRHISHLLSLNGCTVLDRRLEQVEGLHVDAVVTRALFGISQFVINAGKILNMHGILILSKGPKLISEAEGEKDYSISVYPVTLPFLNVKRNLVTVRMRDTSKRENV